ncbi:hypothetical protein AZE42_13100 [Rhizopogon vesiculosus]|uniref:Uncharacterized protein n=1 Tax=Rhizopogon vesiculosus TaxID=180088 RepID=A0A1J8PVG7_9AGAM|nr:hypothetical protein AZE42_13100 [Rhizopogon vesiculosus]
MPKCSLRARVAIENLQGWEKKRKVSEDRDKENKTHFLVPCIFYRAVLGFCKMVVLLQLHWPLFIFS